MDEWTLNDLLECSVCLERLDTSSKVLPCQHTFCRKCLEEIVSTHKELRCPECRILVDSQIDDLPPNVLLMRILEGMKNSSNPLPKKKTAASSFLRQQIQLQQQQHQHHPQGIQSLAPPPNLTYFENGKLEPAQKQNNPQVQQPFARAIYDYVSKEAGDLNFRKGELILLHRKVDSQWCQGESGGKVGIFPLSYVQVMNPLPNQSANCRALYDFRMVNDEDEGCLSFRKDEIITVIRRVDENWAEGKLNDQIGIFPLAFVELNNVAQALMKLSINGQPGPSRVAPPTPNAEESTPLIPTDHSGVISNCVSLHPTNQNLTVRGAVPATAAIPGTESGSSSTTTPSNSSSITPNSSSNTSSTSNSAPNSPPSSQPPQSNPNPFLSSSSVILQATESRPNPPRGNPPASHGVVGHQQAAVGTETFPDTHFLWAPAQSGDVANYIQHPKEKRHSFSSAMPNHQNSSTSEKHTSDKINSESGSDVQNGIQLKRHGSKKHRRSGSDLSSRSNLPAGYVALYPYKPQKGDELELKKGGLYWVTERCQDGWFKGTSYRTQKSGVFPGNYVTLATSSGMVQGIRHKDVRSPVTTVSTPLHEKTVHQQQQQQQKTGKASQIYGQLIPPELPPRASSPSVRHQRSAFQNSSASWQLSQGDFSSSQKNVGEVATISHHPAGSTEGRTNLAASGSSVLHSSSSSSSSTPSKSVEKVKEKKEKTGLIKRLTTIKITKSPPESASYSMDNPVFDDAPAAAAAATGSHQVQQHQRHIHLRSGSCPSQLIPIGPEGGGFSHRIGSASARLKHRERPSVNSACYSPGTSRPPDGSAIAKVGSPAGTSHRKSNSLDAGDTRKPRQLVPPVRERFRCIVPYPPNSEYELELKVGDIIYVHRKREDGWYKGTQQRTGRTGLFPASFVETY